MTTIDHWERSMRPMAVTPGKARALLKGWKTQERRVCSNRWRPPSPGDLIWVQEQFRIWDRLRECDHLDDCACPSTGTPIYWTDAGDIEDVEWLSAKSMWISASRITLQVLEVRKEPLHRITEQDVVYEGGRPCWGELDQNHLAPLGYTMDAKDKTMWVADSLRGAFIRHWDTTHPPEHRWEKNPEICVLTFQPHRLNVTDFIGGKRAPILYGMGRG